MQSLLQLATVHLKGGDGQVDSVLSSFQTDLILSVCPSGSRVLSATYFQHQYLPGPIKVHVETRCGRETQLVLRIARHGQNKVKRETQLYAILAKLGLPVPQVLSEVVIDPGNPQMGQMVVLSLLPGQDLQKMSTSSRAGLRIAGSLLVEAIDRLHTLTKAVYQERVSDLLPKRTMVQEFQQVLSDEGPWTQQEQFHTAAERLKPVLALNTTPLAFSNGDYQPGNFLANGDRLTGFLDFESACFEDPHIGLAKYMIHDLHPLNKAGLVRQYLQTHCLSEKDFAPRLALRCLATLQREVSVSGQEDAQYRRHVFDLLHRAFNQMGGCSDFEHRAGV